MILRRLAYLALAGTVFLPIACNSDDGVTLQGCGATFPAPLYKRWFLEFYRQSPDVRVNYQAIGSGAGVRQFEEGLVDFGATDEALKADRLKAIAQKLSEREGKTVEVIQIPATGGAVALCYNLPGDPPLKLTREVYVSILLGEITEWDHPKIQALNPGVNLPKLGITFVRRAESSGTTFVFTSHLNAVDKRWKQDEKDKSKGGPGAGKTVQWPVGIGGKGNAGVAALIQQTPGAFGYLEAGYAELIKLPMAEIMNHAKQYHLPTAESARAALEEAKSDKKAKYHFNEALGVSITDPEGPEAYPIVTYTWIVCRKHYPNPRIGEKLKAVLSYCLESKTPGRGQEISKGLGYVPMPEPVLAEARKKVQEINAQ